MLSRALCKRRRRRRRMMRRRRKCDERELGGE
jgi:hypothetical protein